VFAISIISPEEQAEDFRGFTVTTRKYGLFRENMAYLRIIWLYLRKSCGFKGNIAVLE
jgi:hypothetical protein